MSFEPLEQQEEEAPIMSEMKDTKPYIVKALYDWILDNGMTPQIIIHTCFSGLDIPENLKGDMDDVHRRVLLNIGPSAIAGLSFDLKGGDMRFFARFSGSSYGVRIPIRAIESIYRLAREYSIHSAQRLGGGESASRPKAC